MFQVHTFTRTGHIPDNKTALNKFRRLETLKRMSTDHKVAKLEMSDSEMSGQSPNVCR